MKKILMLMFLIVFVAACNSSALSFKEVTNVPQHVQDKIDVNLKLQEVTDSGKGYYIVYHSTKDVKAVAETEGKRVNVKLIETEANNDMIKQYTYYLKSSSIFDEIDVLINGESTPFDQIFLQ